jgi:hypothetical protein
MHVCIVTLFDVGRCVHEQIINARVEGISIVSEKKMYICAVAS